MTIPLAPIIQTRSGQFFLTNNLVDLANVMVVPGPSAIVAHLILASGGIDVSFPVPASLAVYATTRILVDQGFNGSVIVPFPLAMLFGAPLGVFNGMFTSWLTVPTLVIMLGAANVFSGVMQGAFKSIQILSIPRSMKALGESALFTVTNTQPGLKPVMPTSFLIFLAVLAIVSFITRHAMFGRGILTTSSNESATERAEFKIRCTELWLYVIVGVIATLADMVCTTSMGQMHPTNLLGMEMIVIVVAVLRGTAIAGGTSSPTGTVLGTLLIVVIQNSMILTSTPILWQGSVFGPLIITGAGVSAIQMARPKHTQAAGV